MPTPLKIIYAGNLAAGMYGTCEQRLEAFRDLGHEVVPVRFEPLTSMEKWLRTIRSRVLNSRYIPRANRDIRSTARATSDVNLFWLDKAQEISANTMHVLREVHPNVPIIGYSPDDMMNPDNQPREFLATLPLYDVYFTTKSYNVPELKALGANRVEFVDNAFHPQLHRPIDLTAAEREHLGAPVGFIGSPEPERAASIARLAETGVEIKVWGDGWGRQRELDNARYTVGGGSQWGEGFSRTICAFDINLAFLRKVNRDLQTTRSIEIPACGGFMLAERTDEHLRLFEEGVDAEFFSSEDEMIEKARYYLDHPEERKRIAEAGRRRCIESGYSNQDRLKDMLERVFTD